MKMSKSRIEQAKKLEPIKVDYHRNGVAGIGFHVGIVKHVDKREPELKDREFLIIQFNPENNDNSLMNTAVLDFELLKKGEIRFFHNSWRGDQFADGFKIVTDREYEKEVRNRKDPVTFADLLN